MRRAAFRIRVRLGHAVHQSPRVLDQCLQIDVRASVQGTGVVIEVHDTGPGPAVDAVDGVGLRNSRERLTQAFGRAATLALQSAGPCGGCIARIDLPLSTLEAA